MKNGRISALEDLQERILRARSIDELMPELQRLYGIMERRIARSPLDGAALDRIAKYLADLRYLLDELGSAAAHLLPRESVWGMAERYRDLEGRVKEWRNDRLRRKGGQSGEHAERVLGNL